MSFNRIKKFILNYWWVITVAILCFIFYEQELKERHQLHDQLLHQLVSLEKDKQKTLEEQKNLELQLNSQSDPEWIELVLKKRLGLVAEGEEKFFFTAKM